MLIETALEHKKGPTTAFAQRFDQFIHFRFN